MLRCQINRSIITIIITRLILIVFWRWLGDRKGIKLQLAKVYKWGQLVVSATPLLDSQSDDIAIVPFPPDQFKPAIVSGLTPVSTFHNISFIDAAVVNSLVETTPTVQKRIFKITRETV